MAAPKTTLRLRKALERAISRGHPWIYRDALKPFTAKPGAIVTVLDRRGRFLARGLAEKGAIGVRVLTTQDQPIDDDLLHRRLEAALVHRDRLQLEATDALRLVHGEGDRLPGVVLDRYADVAVLKLDGAAISVWRDRLSDLLRPLLADRGVKSLVERTGRGEHKRASALWGRLPVGPVEVREHGMRLWADIGRGQKTGMFLDHRDSRRRVRELAQDRRVLNLYGYTGAFSVAAGLGGAARVVTVDSARPAIAAAEENWALNGLPPDRHRAVCALVEPFLSEEREAYDLVIADPPSFAPKKAALRKALTAYRAMHRGALERVAGGGLYLAASCSSHVTAAAFDRTIQEGAAAARRRLKVVERGGAAPDHPVLAGFPEGAYLKVVLAEVR